jgi:uncharacterized membrane protein
MAESFDTALKKVAANYLRLLNTPVTATSIAQQIENHPNYPSLLSLSEAFSRYHIPNGAFEVGEEQFDEVDSPFVAFTEIPGIGKDFVLVTDKNKDTVSFRHARRNQTLSKEEFLKRYQKVIWAAEPDAGSGETEYADRLKDERVKHRKRLTWCAGAGALLLLAFFISLPAGAVFAFSAIVLLKLLGVGATALLLTYEIDKSNTFVKDICSAGKQFHCDAVLTSKAARIKGISWGEIGFFYFGATTLLLFAGGISFAQKTALLAVGNLLAAPYILFSLYYQWRVLKQWCPMCLTVQGILALELGWSVVTFWTASLPVAGGLSLLPLAIGGACLLLTAVGWYGIKPVLVKAKDADAIAASHKRLQYNPDIFDALLKQQPAIPAGWEKLGIALGPANAATTIVKVCNPFCGPCSRAHPELENLLHNYDVQIRIIFNSQNKEADYSANTARHLMAIAEKGDAALTKRALDDWYGMKEKDYAVFAARWPLDGDVHRQDAKLEAMYGWVDAGDVRYTPTLFINGHKLPTHYKLQELKNIL